MRTNLRATLVLALALAAGCTSTYTRTSRAADTLELKADEFAAGRCAEPNSACPPGEYLDAARKFAYDTHEFRQSLDRRSDQEVVASFKRLWHSYHTLRHEVDGLRDRQLRSKLKPIRRAFVDVQRHVKTGYSHADPDLYASGGYKFDPYYN